MTEKKLNEMTEEEFNAHTLAKYKERQKRNNENWFQYHAPFGDQAERYGKIRAAGGAFANLLVDLCPPSQELDRAIQLIREATFVANSSISCNEYEKSNK